MSTNSVEYYKKLLERSEEQRRQAEERQRQAEERTRKTTFLELIHCCHEFLSVPLRVAPPNKSTTGSIPIPKEKYCPTKLRLWKDSPARHREIYNSVRRYLQPANADAPRLFPPKIVLEGFSAPTTGRPLSSEHDLGFYERFAVDQLVGGIISELCNIPAAKHEFGLGSGIQFHDHTNFLQDPEFDEAAENQPSKIRRPKADAVCIHAFDNDTMVHLSSGEYKPPHKLPTSTIRLGLRPMQLWDDMVGSDTIPTGKAEKLKYNAERLVCSAIVQQYHVMIQEGLEFAYVTNGFCDIQLWVPHDDPSTLKYYLYDPIKEVGEDDGSFLAPNTAIARRLCLYLLSCRHPVRSQEWRNDARRQLPLWQTNFSRTRQEIPKDELKETHLHAENTDPVSPDTSSQYRPEPESSSSPSPPPKARRRRPVQSQTCGATLDARRRRSESPGSSGSDVNTDTTRKRSISQVASSPSARPKSRTRSARGGRGSRQKQHDAKFCTLRCLLGLRDGGALDEKCPNVELHRRDGEDTTHPTNAEHFVRSLKEQLDEDLDRNCTPFGHCGGYGAPFKLTSDTYGYTVVGKGTSRELWPEVSREADAYHILRRAQASAVPVFLGKIDLANIYFLHGAGEIRHMLIMGWGGENPDEEIEEGTELCREVWRSIREIRRMGVEHEDLRRENILWNEELQRALIIDFHRSKLVPQHAVKRSRPVKRLASSSADEQETRQERRQRRQERRLKRARIV
ncbi:Lipopolysaccharide kinase [Metarhizium album ARSEF 1941]|uniref:Lipopolysaccharide kinase n=1 Tax=Metarhizium album (strain ARSEF 1941) TaxID=1081103 RepID=A0A0B2X554_METAS|nr:Lipopolysaccharide kinase [Metarhizium album ARSEF 1941]KHO00585.1 Lipopolysaccharide kinase [Metarhizium album ARSEF 1941]